MAIGNNAKTKTSSAKAEDRKPAEGFLNKVTILDKHGNPHTVRCTIALYEDDPVHRAMLTKGGEFTFTGTVYVPSKEPVEIEL